MKLDDDLLAAGLGAAAITQRREVPTSHATDSEIVACRLGDGSVRQLFCKFGPVAETAPPIHRFGAAYEAQVYDQLLPAWRDDVPRLHGAFLDETTQAVGLALEYLEGAVPFQHLTQPKAGLMAAARWIARFHRWSETATVPSFLHRYDTEFYRVWMQRAGHFTRCLHERYPWLPDLCERCQRRLPALLPPATIIHGDFQAANILVQNDRNITIDWQSAALAAGEIDLASLTQGLSSDLAGLCEQQYCLDRWPDSTPDGFSLRLAAARVFLQFRRLGKTDEGVASEATISDVDKLLPLAERLRELER
jgi:fructosamine-3-kinase